ncbi:MAG TPA: D-alanine--D-alanine ligase family protein [Bryobacteraceae bacterium]|nr:D-alanine--D-alanine ligase family protein [Bryobacteraceae bacterium]
MKTRVAVIYGGRSGEHEISLRSARSVIDAMDPGKYEVLHYIISKEGKWSPGPILPEPDGNPGIDVVFPVLHGTFGEDGTVQGLLELADLPYVGAGVLASSLSMDKDLMKRVASSCGLPVVEHVVVPCDGRWSIPFGFPMFVKPANLGSSVGISKVHNGEDLTAAIELASSYDRKVIVERGITGREFECAVLGNDKPVASAPCEILPSREFYDYEDKYELDQAQTVIPANLSTEQTAELRLLAVQCYRAVECEGMARVDFLLESETGKLYINEINTIPGFTSISMYPKMWEHSGLPMPQLIDRLIELAMERHEARKRLRYSR